MILAKIRGPLSCGWGKDVLWGEGSYWAFCVRNAFIGLRVGCNLFICVFTMET
jgi:hypothetical protein